MNNLWKGIAIAGIWIACAIVPDTKEQLFFLAAVTSCFIGVYG